MKRIEEFEGLRGLLAMWVFATHIVSISGFPWASFRQPVRTFVNGAFAVDVFIILSGFVISMLISARREPYKLFVARRFLRLFPAYLVCVVAAFVLGLADVVPQIYRESQLAAHAIAHLTMLHGAVPNRVLPHAASAFLDPAWSISTEWQFYLLIPLFFAAFKFRPLLAWVGLLVVALLGSRLTHRFGSWDHMAFVPLKLNFFAIGIFSYFVFMWMEGNKELFREVGRYFTITFLAFALMFSVVTSQLGLYIWLVVFGSVLAVRLNDCTAFDKSISAALKSKFLQWLGTISYSVYLSHNILIWITIKFLKTAFPEISRLPLLLGVVVFSIPLTLIVSFVLFHIVETPAIRFGKRLENRTNSQKYLPDEAVVSQ